MSTVDTECPARMVDFAHNYVNIDGTPFRLSGRPYLWPLYTQPFKRVMLKFGRQCEKSTAIAIRMLFFSFGIPHFRSLYVTPSQDQTRQFSTDKIKPLITNSPVLAKKFIMNQEKIDRVFQKQFANGSTVHFRGAFSSPDRTRGITADHLAIDEIQDMIHDHIPVILETTSHSNYKYLIYAGTPKTHENTLQQKWEETTQNEFFIKCTGCNTYNFIGEGNIGLHGPICAKCGKGLNNSNGLWVSENPGAYIEGFRLPQLIVPWADWEEIKYKYESYEKGKFYNEVLGLAHDLAENPVTRKQLIVCCDPHRLNVPRLTPVNPTISDKLPFYPELYMGVDWGLNLGSYTVLAVGGFMGKRFDVLYLERFTDIKDHMQQIERIAEIAYKFNVKVIGTDFGSGYMEAQELQKRVSDRLVVKIYTAGNQKEKIKWNASAGMLSVHRDNTLSDLFSLIGRSTTTDRLITFPRYQDFEIFGKDFLSIFKDYNSRTRRVYYDHPQDKPDDVAHAVNFLNLIATVQGRPNL